MVDKINALEKIARSLELNYAERENVISQSISYIQEFIESLPDSKAYIDAECPTLKTLQITDEGKPFEQLLNLIKKEVVHGGINPASGGHLGFIPGGGLWISSIADMIAAATNKYAGIFFSGRGAVVLENQLIKWLTTLVGYPGHAHGNLSSGGSIANLIAITTARDVHKIQSENVRKAVIYFTDQVHHCIDKALHITGLGEAIHRIVPTNSLYQMDVDALKDMIEEDIKSGNIPFLVVASAGTTNTGSFDPLNNIADVCEKHRVWFHVDAAYGGFFLLVDSVKEKFEGIERSDSVVLDPHKGLFLPFGTGVVLVRDGAALMKSHSYKADYMINAEGYDEISPSGCSPELTKHFRGLRMWLPLHMHGLNVFKACLEEKLFLCQYFHEKIQELGFETGNRPELSVTMFRYPANNSDTFNKELVIALHGDGRIFFSSTMMNGKLWIRCAILSFRTHLREVNLGLAMISEQLEKIKTKAYE